MTKNKQWVRMKSVLVKPCSGTSWNTAQPEESMSAVWIWDEEEMEEEVEEMEKEEEGFPPHRTAHTQGLAVFLTYAPPLTVSPQMSKRDCRTAGEERETSEGEMGRKKEET